jgi:hypothetical protein
MTDPPTAPRDDSILLNLSRYEALVLFEWLASFDASDAGPPQDSAEQAVLWRLEGRLEERLVEVILPNYRELLDDARRRVLAGNDSGAEG